jgi:hypothetical protein
MRTCYRNQPIVEDLRTYAPENLTDEQCRNILGNRMTTDIKSRLLLKLN